MFRVLVFICAILTNFHIIHAKEDLEPIVIWLSSETALLPLYASPLRVEESKFPASYTKQLEDILKFDLGHNGATYLVKKTDELDAIDKKTGFEEISQISLWERQKIFYVIKAAIKGNQLFAKILSVNNQTIKVVDPILLSGNLSEDRKKMHLLADAVHQALFHREGIASTHILYTVKRQMPDGKTWSSDVYEADYDGGNVRQITSTGGYCVTPLYIPSSHGFRSGNFCYVSYQIGQPKIYVASLQEGKGKRLLSLKGNQLMPAINRQRNKVAFISDVTGNPDLFLQAFDPEKGALDKPYQIFAAHLATQGTPSFSPDGKKLAFVSNKDGSTRIYIMDVPEKGSKLQDIKAHLLTKNTRESSAPCWSPDGKKIAYCSLTQGTRQIWVYDFEKNKDFQLTSGSGHKENPTWAPNSLHLVFNSTGNNASELYLINLNQKEAVKISSGPGEKRFPSWEP